jgi:hypothetical protein
MLQRPVEPADRNGKVSASTLVNVVYRADPLRRESVSIFKRTSKRSKIDSEPLQPGPQYWQFFFHESALFTTE